MDDSAADNDAAFVALVEELDSADDERRGKLARQLEADGAVQAAPRMAAAADARPRWAAARIMHLLPDEAHLMRSCRSSTTPSRAWLRPRGGRCGARSATTPGAPRWSGSRTTGRRSGAQTRAAG